MNHRMSHRAVVPPAFIFIVALAAFSLAQGYWTWTSEEVAAFNPDYLMSSVSLAFSPPSDPSDPSDGGYPAIAYVNHVNHVSIQYTWYDGHAWVWPHQKVDAKVNGNIGPKLAFNPVTKRPAIAYGGLNLKFAQFDGTAWRVQVVDPDEAQNGPVSLAFLADGSPAIAYQARVGGRRNMVSSIRYAECTVITAGVCRGWTTEVVDDKAPVSMRTRAVLAFEPGTSNPTIAYSAVLATYDWPYAPSAELRFATGTDNALKTHNWSIAMISNAQGSGADVNLAYDSAGNPAIVDRAGESYESEAVPNGQVLRFFKRGSGGWSSGETILGPPEVGMNPTLEFDQSGQALVAYQYGPNFRGLKIAWLSGGTWTHDFVYQSAAEGYDQVSFALDGLWRPALAYRLMVSGVSGAKMMYTRSWQ